MTRSVAKLGLDLKTLAPGFHHRRFSLRDIGFDAWIWHGGPGPVIVLNGATHDDEYEGPTLLRQWAEDWRPTRLHGTVVMVPVLNEAAFYAGTRCHPADNGNLARAFPGNAKGTVTARLAHLFDTQLLAQATHYVDLHSGGAAYKLHPWVGYLTRNDRAGRAQRHMAACFDDFWCWAGPFLPGRTLSAAHARNIPAIYVECSGAGGVLPKDLKALDRGVENLLRWTGCINLPLRPLKRQKQRVTRDAQEAHLQVHHPSPAAGLFQAKIALGGRVRKGQVLGVVRPLNETENILIKAERSGRVVLARFQSSVRPGDALFTLAPV